MKDLKSLGLRIDSEAYRKLCYMAAREQRSLNRQVAHMIEEYVASFEAKYGPIPEDGADSG